MGFSKFILKVLGWKTVGSVVQEPKCIILEAPHTSMWDFLIGYWYYRSVGGKLSIMIKKEFFFFSVGPAAEGSGSVSN